MVLLLVSMTEFTINGLSRHAFGFANPNHAAAAICAMFPFCWGWGGAAVARVAKFWMNSLGDCPHWRKVIENWINAAFFLWFVK